MLVTARRRSRGTRTHLCPDSLSQLAQILRRRLGLVDVRRVAVGLHMGWMGAAVVRRDACGGRGLLVARHVGCVGGRGQQRRLCQRARWQQQAEGQCAGEGAEALDMLCVRQCHAGRGVERGGANRGCVFRGTAQACWRASRVWQRQSRRRTGECGGQANQTGQRLAMQRMQTLARRCSSAVVMAGCRGCDGSARRVSSVCRGA
jgi:hypothetical protein